VDYVAIDNKLFILTRNKVSGGFAPATILIYQVNGTKLTPVAPNQALVLYPLYNPVWMAPSGAQQLHVLFGPPSSDLIVSLDAKTMKVVDGNWCDPKSGTPDGGAAGSAGHGGTGGSAGHGGTSGTAGTAGKGGSGGNAGNAGHGGTAGKGGSSGSAGHGGSSGTAGHGGSSGIAGKGGTAGAAGKGGSGGNAGTAGHGGTAGTAGKGGSSGSAGKGGTGGVK